MFGFVCATRSGTFLELPRWLFALLEKISGRSESWKRKLPSERYSAEAWKNQYSPINDWEATFRHGQWDYLASISELPRYALIAGYIHKFIIKGAILDAGCGEGILMDYLDKRRIDYAGFDPSETAISRAQQRYSAASLSIGSVEDFKLETTKPFDVVVFNEVLSQVASPLETLDHFIHFVKQNGFAIVSLYQSSDERANGRILTRMLETEISAARYKVLAKANVENEKQMKWSIYCLR